MSDTGSEKFTLKEDKNFYNPQPVDRTGETEAPVDRTGQTEAPDDGTATTTGSLRLDLHSVTVSNPSGLTNPRDDTTTSNVQDDQNIQDLQDSANNQKDADREPVPVPVPEEKPEEKVKPVTIKIAAEDIKQVLISGLLQKINHQLKKDFGQGGQPVSEGGDLLQPIDVNNVGKIDGDIPFFNWQSLPSEPERGSLIVTSIQKLQQALAAALSGNRDDAGEGQISNMLPTVEEIKEYERSSGQLLNKKSGSWRTVKFSKDIEGVKFITSDGLPYFRAVLQTYLMWNKIAQKIQQNLTTVPIASQINEGLSSAQIHLLNMVIKHIVVHEWGIVDPQIFTLAMFDVRACINGDQPTNGTMIHGLRKIIKIIKELIEHDSLQ